MNLITVEDMNFEQLILSISGYTCVSSIYFNLDGTIVMKLALQSMMYVIAEARPLFLSEIAGRA